MTKDIMKLEHRDKHGSIIEEHVLDFDDNETRALNCDTYLLGGSLELLQEGDVLRVIKERGSDQ